MTTSAPPVLMVVFNRPDYARRVLDAVREAAPTLLLVAADGPRPEHPDDVELCAAARAVIDTVDWPCEVVRQFSDSNLGPDRRVASAIDWAFTQADRAVILEDDVVPSPSFFPWCAAMLDRYDSVSDVLQVSGRNDLGRWGSPGSDHLIVRRGSIWGWGTWADSWNRVNIDLPGAADSETLERLDALRLDPVLRSHIARHLAAAADGTLRAWDCRWSTGRMLADGWSVIPPVNLVANIGFGPTATRTQFSDDPRFLLSAGEAPVLDTGAGRPEADAEYDRRALLFELMATYREPEVIAKLARSRRLLVRPDGTPDHDALHHLAPVDYASESLDVIEHLRGIGVTSAQLGRIARAIAPLATDLVAP